MKTLIRVGIQGGHNRDYIKEWANTLMTKYSPTPHNTYNSSDLRAVLATYSSSTEETSVLTAT